MPTVEKRTQSNQGEVTQSNDEQPEEPGGSYYVVTKRPTPPYGREMGHLRLGLRPVATSPQEIRENHAQTTSPYQWKTPYNGEPPGHLS